MTEESALLYLRQCRLQLSHSELEILLCRHYSIFQPCAVFWRQHDQQDKGALYRRGAEFKNSQAMIQHLLSLISVMPFLVGINDTGNHFEIKTFNRFVPLFSEFLTLFL